ncbi:P-loop containing nucleoside triphosphate hydrolase protein [Serendipita vermifera]|nr:P-loop containing nucleoside triphosphate hydrolase protein [Serendipita vermifera]
MDMKPVNLSCSLKGGQLDAIVKSLYPHPMASTLAQPAIIAVIGPTGAGKSTLINAASGTDAMKIGAEGDLISCTTEVVPSRPFLLDNHEVVLLDTPGFDNTQETTFYEVLCQIRDHLTQQCDRKPLKGIIYIHGIDEGRPASSIQRVIQEVHHICDRKPERRLIVATTMWDVVDPAVAFGRESQLMRDKNLMGPLVDSQVKIVRHYGSTESAQDIVRYLLKNSENLAPLDSVIDRTAGDKNVGRAPKKPSFRRLFKQLLGIR